MVITKKSSLTGKTSSREINVTALALEAWKQGTRPIQNCLPHLSADDREFLMTGVTPEEWDAAFPSTDHE